MSAVNQSLEAWRGVVFCAPDTPFDAARLTLRLATWGDLASVVAARKCLRFDDPRGLSSGYSFCYGYPYRNFF